MAGVPHLVGLGTERVERAVVQQGVAVHGPQLTVQIGGVICDG